MNSNIFLSTITFLSFSLLGLLKGQKKLVKNLGRSNGEIFNHFLWYLSDEMDLNPSKIEGRGGN